MSDAKTAGRTVGPKDKAEDGRTIDRTMSGHNGHMDGWIRDGGRIHRQLEDGRIDPIAEGRTNERMTGQRIAIYTDGRTYALGEWCADRQTSCQTIVNHVV